MKKLFLLSFLFAVTSSFAEELPHFSDVASAVSQGRSIHIVTNSMKCTPNNKMVPSTVFGIFSPDSIQLTDTFLAASLMQFTLNDPIFVNEPVYEFVSYTLLNNDSLDLTYQALDPVDYVPLNKKISVNCKMGDGVKVYD